MRLDRFMPSDDEILFFVRESQKIENEPPNADAPSFKRHYGAAKFAFEQAAEKGRLWPPKPLHAFLMKGSELEPKYVGEYRPIRVAVGGRECPHPSRVRGMMKPMLERLKERLKDETAIADYLSQAPDVFEDSLWELHKEFEYIHPFVDGNGRVGRIWWNAVRIVCGLRLKPVLYDKRQEYYAELAEYSLHKDLLSWARAREGS